MIPAGCPDLAACRHWRASIAFDGLRIGLVPAWNAAVALNGAAGDLWDLLVAGADAGTLALLYRARRPDRADRAEADIADCLAAWQAQGLFAPPAATAGAVGAAAAPGPQPPPAFRRALSLGARSVTLEIEDAVLAATVADMTAGFPAARDPAPRLVRAAGPAGGWRLCRDGAVVRRADSLAELRGALVSELVRQAGDWHAVIHAAVLARGGRAVLLAGPSGAGKSTLAAGLVARGWQMLAEDCAPFDAAMRVAPLPFALSLKAGSVAVLADAFPGLAAARVHRIGRRRVRYQPLPPATVAPRPLRPELIVDVRYRADFAPDRAELRPLAPVERLALFLTEESHVDFERDTDNAFLRFVETTPGLALDHGGLAAAEGAILRQLDRAVAPCC